MINKILGISPWVEVFIKFLYWRFNFINTFLAHLARKKNKIHSKKIGYIDFSKVIDLLISSGLNVDSTLIVHSSWDALKSTNKTSLQICESLFNLVKDGALVMPAIPIFKAKRAGIDRLLNSYDDEITIYDVEKARVSTGALPATMLKMEGSIRSPHPLNSIVAMGKVSSKLVEGNIEGDASLPCGMNSSWFRCYQNNAYIVCLGVDASHSLTMIHVAEDAWPEIWPIKNWYRNRIFKIVYKGREFIKTIQERDPKWSIFYAERTLQKDLVRNGVCKQFNIDGLHIELLSSKALIDFLNNRKSSAYPYFIPFFLR